MRDQRTGKIGVENRQQLLELIDQGKTAGEIADTFGVNPETVRKFARKRGLNIHRQDMHLENHPCWKDGTTLDRSGYILQRVDSEGEFGYLIRALQKRGMRHPDRFGYAPTHRIVMHQKLGRPLSRGEVVDHIDGNKTNNNPSNLQVFASNAEHLKATLKGKCPNWTAEGKARMTGRPKGSRNKPKMP